MKHNVYVVVDQHRVTRWGYVAEFRKDVEYLFLKDWTSTSYPDWKAFYKLGYRIKKAILTIDISY